MPPIFLTLEILRGTILESNGIDKHLIRRSKNVFLNGKDMIITPKIYLINLTEKYELN